MSAIDAITTLRHFALVTYAVPPERVRPLIHPRFDLDLVTIDGAPRALLSVVLTFRFRSGQWRRIVLTDDDVH